MIFHAPLPFDVTSQNAVATTRIAPPPTRRHYHGPGKYVMCSGAAHKKRLINTGVLLPVFVPGTFRESFRPRI